MDAERITDLLKVHGNAITWESHVAFVDAMSTWEPDQILDYQESLLDHLSRGAWVGTSQNRVIQTASGEISADGLAEQISTYETLLEIVPSEIADDLRSEYDSAQNWRPSPPVKIAVPDGSIGIPFHPWTLAPWIMKHYEDPRKERAMLLKCMHNDLSGGGTNELRLVLRAAPWAYFRRTGHRLTGVEPCDLEEFQRTGRLEFFTSVITLRRGGDSVQYLAFTPAPSADSAAVDRSGNFKAFARLLDASIVRIEGRAIDGVAVDEKRWFVHDAQVISDRPADAEVAEPNALSVALAALLFSTSVDRSNHPRLAEEDFWKLITLVDDDLSDESVDRLISALAKKPVKAIIGFHETLTDVLYRLDRPELAKPPASSDPSAMSDDVFLYFRCAVVARGAIAVAGVLAAGGIVEDDWRGEMGEALLMVAPNAFEQKTGEPFEHETEFSYESASNAEAWGGTPAPTGALPVAAFGVRSHSFDADGNGRERVRFWATGSREEALERHDKAEGELWGANYRGVLDAVALPPYDSLSIQKALARVSYYRPI